MFTLGQEKPHSLLASYQTSGHDFSPGDKLPLPNTNNESSSPQEKNVVNPQALPSFACGHDGSVLIYPHGFDLRVRLLIPLEQARKALQKVFWPPEKHTSLWLPRRRRFGVSYLLRGSKPLGKEREPTKGEEKQGQNAKAGKAKNPSKGKSKPSAKAKPNRRRLRGSTTLKGRPPRKSRSVMARMNQCWETNLYGLAVDVAQDAIYLDLKGTTFADVDRLCQSVMGLPKEQYCVEYFRRLERYIVLAPHEAIRLQRALNASSCSGRGPMARKSFLVMDYPLETTIRARKKSIARLTVYRVKNAATYAYKVEVALTGAREDRGEFTLADVDALDRHLLNLIALYGLHPLPKPSRWAPKVVDIHPWDKDDALAMTTLKAYRGSEMDRGLIREARKCLTDDPVELVDLVTLESLAEQVQICHTKGETLTSSSQGVFPSGKHPSSTPSLIRSPRIPEGGEAAPPDSPLGPLATEPKGEEIRWKLVYERGDLIRRYMREGEEARPLPIRGSIKSQAHGPYEALAKEINNLEGTMTEVVMAEDVDPGEIINAVVQYTEGKVGVVKVDFADHSYYSVHEAVEKHPADGDCRTIIAVLDPTMLTLVADAWNQDDWSDIHAASDGPFSDEPKALVVHQKPGPFHPHAAMARRYMGSGTSLVPEIAGGEGLIDPTWLVTPQGSEGLITLDDLLKATLASPDVTEPPVQVSPLPAFSGWDGMASYSKVLGLLLFDLLQGWRRVCEETGVRLVLVTSDNRSDSGQGPWQQSHVFSNARVRSLIGDAGRYNAHVRYLVETVTLPVSKNDGKEQARIKMIETRYVERIVTIKDEAEGRTGRLVYVGNDRKKSLWKRRHRKATAPSGVDFEALGKAADRLFAEEV